MTEKGKTTTVLSLLRMDPGLDSTAYGGDGSISGGAGGCFPDQIPSICVAMLRLFLMRESSLTSALAVGAPQMTPTSVQE
jgi:hypothetical protein